MAYMLPKMNYDRPELDLPLSVRKHLCHPCGDFLEYETIILKDAPQRLAEYLAHVQGIKYMKYRIKQSERKRMSHCYICSRRIRFKQRTDGFYENLLNSFLDPNNIIPDCAQGNPKRQ